MPGMPNLGTLTDVPRINKTAPYLQIAEHYRALIRSGAMPAGSPMPSIHTIRKEWDVATSTAGRVVVVLRDEGWIVTARGRTTVVAADPPR